MSLVNFPKVRVKEYPEGFAVEIQCKTWYGRKYWKHIISAAGLYDLPWHYKRKEMAISEAARLFDLHIIRCSKF
jgi:hypothetical protein